LIFHFAKLERVAYADKGKTRSGQKSSFFQASIKKSIQQGINPLPRTLVGYRRADWLNRSLIAA
jgi:hypothetical protein